MVKEGFPEEVALALGFTCVGNVNAELGEQQVEGICVPASVGGAQ